VQQAAALGTPITLWSYWPPTHSSGIPAPSKSKIKRLNPSIAFVGTTSETLYIFGATDGGGQMPAAQFSKFDTATEAIEDIGAPAVGGPGSWGTMTSSGNGNVFYLERGFNRRPSERFISSFERHRERRSRPTYFMAAS
jgi:hypothetical protein